MKLRPAHLVLPAVVVGLTAAAVFAQVVLVKTSTKAKGATTITWDSAFEDVDYSMGAVATFTVNWTVDAGAADYDGFVLKKVTPRSKRDPAEGELISAIQVGNSVHVQFMFTELHTSDEEEMKIGNAHLKLYLIIDKDGNGVPESRAGYGVNLHVEDPF